MTIPEWKNKAFEGGYSQVGFPEADVDLNTMLLSPRAWQAVGKVEGWDKQPNFDYSIPEDFDINTHVMGNNVRYLPGELWQTKMHRVIDALAEGKTIEQYLETL